MDTSPWKCLVIRHHQTMTFKSMTAFQAGCLPTPGETSSSSPGPRSWGCDFILFYLLKTSGSAERGVETHSLGLGGIQLAEADGADTRTKLLAVLVWLLNRTTHHYGQMVFGKFMEAAKASHLEFIYMPLNLSLYALALHVPFEPWRKCRPTCERSTVLNTAWPHSVFVIGQHYKPSRTDPESDALKVTVKTCWTHVEWIVCAACSFSDIPHHCGQMSWRRGVNTANQPENEMEKLSQKATRPIIRYFISAVDWVDTSVGSIQPTWPVSLCKFKKWEHTLPSIVPSSKQTNKQTNKIPFFSDKSA